MPHHFRTLLRLGAFSAGAIVLWPLYILAFRFGGHAAGILVLIGIPALLWYVLDRPDWVTRRRLQGGQCLHCGYDLTGNVSGVCPECGSPT